MKIKAGLLFLILIMIVLASGCHQERPATVTGLEGKSTQFLQGGLQMVVSPSAVDDILMLSFECVTDGSIYAVSEITDDPYDDMIHIQNSYLVHRTTGERIPALTELDGKPYASPNYVYYDIPYDQRENYILYYEVNALLTLSNAYPVKLSWKGVQKQEINKKIELPDSYWIMVDNVSVAEIGDQNYADIQYQLSSDKLFYDVNVLHSKVSTGAAIGEIESRSSNTFLYHHPIQGTETELEISFENMSYHKLLKGSMEIH